MGVVPLGEEYRLPTCLPSPRADSAAPKFFPRPGRNRPFAYEYWSYWWYSRIPWYYLIGWVKLLKWHSPHHPRFISLGKGPSCPTEELSKSGSGPIAESSPPSAALHVRRWIMCRTAYGARARPKLPLDKPFSLLYPDHPPRRQLSVEKRPS